MTSTLPILTPTSPALTPNTRTEAEAALSFNSAYQTASAGAPQTDAPANQPRPPLLTRNSSNYATAASQANLSFEPPYPTESTAEAVRGNLSRGVTSAVLEKMASPTSPPPAETLLSKRASREGERRTSQIAADGGAQRPVAYQRQSYNQEDLKRIMSEKLMKEVDAAPANASGYDSVP